jgi:monovalent cation:H+ antiporter, CPA1 family
MNVEIVFILLFVVATAVAIGAQRLRLPYTVALVLAGLGLGALQLFPAPHLTKNLLFSLFLPGLIFEASYHIHARDLRSCWITTLVLAVPGVIASMALVAVCLPPVLALSHLAPGFSWREALVFGALISATDPVAVVGLFRALGTPRRLTVLLEAESLLNDGTAIVLFTLSLSLLEGRAPQASALAIQFIAVVGGGLAIGALVGAAASVLMQHVDDPMIEIALTTIAAYGSFALAETLGSSGVIATVLAGLTCARLGARIGMSAASRIAASTFWQYVAFALNSIVFLLMGLEVHLRTLARYWLAILVAYLVVTLGRALVIVAGRALIGLTLERFPWRWSVVLTWGGLRGALAMVLALSLPRSFIYRDLIVAMTFGVALLSILAHGLSMSTLLKRLGVLERPLQSLSL